MSHVTEWLRRLRINDSFQPTFTTTNNHETNAKVNASTSLCTVVPISTVATPAKPQHYSKRLILSTESRKKKL